MPAVIEAIRAPADTRQAAVIDDLLEDRTIGALAGWIGGRIFALLHNFLATRSLGWVFPAEVGFQCFVEQPALVRKPDVSFVRFGRFPGDQLPEGHARLAPDLVVEVVSPNDLFYDVEQKAFAWLRAGARLVWVVSPAGRTIYAYRAGGPITALHDEELLTGEDVLPGFECSVNEVFCRPVPSGSSGPAST